MDQPRKYVIAAKLGIEPPEDWRQRLAAVGGVDVSGATARRAHFSAPPAAAEEVRSALSSWFHVEEVIERNPAG